MMLRRLFLALLVAGTSLSAQQAWIEISSGPSLPAVCARGTAFFETGVPVSQAFFVCNTSSEWAPQDPAQYDVFVVQSYGAKGDGVSDDLGAILSAAHAAGHGGGVVFFPPGTYLHSGLVDFGSNTLVQGAGDSSIVRGTNNNYSALRFLNSSHCGITQIRTVSKASSRLTTDTSAAILFNGSDSCYARNVTVEGSASVGIMIENSSNMIADSNRVSSTQADGIHVVDGSRNVQVTHNRAFRTGDDSFSAVAYSNLPQTKNVLIDSNVSVGSGARGVACIGAANCTITNNKIYNPLAHGIAVAYETVYNTYVPSGAVIQHNVVRGVTSPIMNALLVAFAKNVQVSDLQIYDSSPLYCHGSNQVQFTGVRIYNTLGAGILGVDCTQLSLKSIQISNATGQGINLQGIQGGALADVALGNLFAAGDAGGGAVQIANSSNVTGSTITVSGVLGPAAGGLLQISNSTGTTVKVTAAAEGLPPQPAVSQQGVVGAAFSEPSIRALSDNGMLAIFGSGFASAKAARGAQTADLVNSYLPQSLGSTCVDIGGARGYLLYVSESQINVVTPLTEPLSQATVEVITNCGQPNEIRSNAASMPVVRTAPEFFVAARNANGQAPAVVVDTATAAPLKTVRPGASVTLYLSGLGAVKGLFTPGLVDGPAGAVALPVQVSIDGATLSAGNVLYCGSNGNAGVYQLNLVLPKGLRNGNLPIQAVIGGATTAPGVYLSVAAP